MVDGQHHWHNDRGLGEAMAVSGFHGLLDPSLQGIHVPYQWSYPNSAARVSATGFIVSDVGKLALQTSDSTLWILTDTTPSWIAVGGGGSPPTAFFDPGQYRLLQADANPGSNSITDHFLIPSGLAVEGTNSNQDDSVSTWVRQLSNGAIDAGGSFVTTQQILKTQWGGEVVFFSKIDSLANVRYFVGISDDDISFLGSHGSSTPSSNYAVFRYATDIDGTSFYRTASDSGTGTPEVNTTTVPIAANTPNRLRLRFGSSGASVKFYIDDVLVAEHTSKVPATGTLMRLIVSVKALNASAKAVSLSRMAAWY